MSPRKRPRFPRRLPRPRRKLPQFFVPEWTGVYENYTRSFVARNFWRVRHLMGSHEDAVQECALIFTRCKNKYVYCDNPRHFMALYKSSLSNQFCRFALNDQRHRHDALPNLLAVAAPAGMETLLADASAEARQVLHALVDLPIEFVNVIFGDKGLAGTNKHSMARRAARLLGFSVERGTIVEISRLLLPQD